MNLVTAIIVDAAVQQSQGDHEAQKAYEAAKRKSVLPKLKQMFEELDAAELSEIVHIMQVQTFRSGQPIFSEGDHGDSWYVLFRGTAAVTKSTPFGPSRSVAELTEHACFGEMAILDGTARSATVSAANDTTVFRFPRVPFNQLLEFGNLGAFKLVHGMARILCQRQRRLTQQVSDLMQEVEEERRPELRRDLGDLLDSYAVSE
jgi:CRP-like cAMP-binding protein